jgi:hypothetical protein
VATEPAGGQDYRELQALRARVDELERELAERTVRANAAVAAAQERSYWLDRFRVDLNSVMRRRGPHAAWVGVRLATALAAHARGGPAGLRKLPARVREILAQEREAARSR